MKQGVVQSEVRRPERFLAVRTGRVRTRAPDPGSVEAEGPDSGLRTAEKRVTHTLYYSLMLLILLRLLRLLILLILL